jgi:hypothetical protein
MFQRERERTQLADCKAEDFDGLLPIIDPLDRRRNIQSLDSSHKHKGNMENGIYSLRIKSSWGLASAIAFRFCSSRILFARVQTVRQGPRALTPRQTGCCELVSWLCSLAGW